MVLGRRRRERCIAGRRSYRLYDAKFRTGDMDLGIGFDAQAIFGAGRQETLRWLSANGHTEECVHLA